MNIRRYRGTRSSSRGRAGSQQDFKSYLLFGSHHQVVSCHFQSLSLEFLNFMTACFFTLWPHYDRILTKSIHQGGDHEKLEMRKIFSLLKVTETVTGSRVKLDTLAMCRLCPCDETLFKCFSFL